MDDEEFEDFYSYLSANQFEEIHEAGNHFDLEDTICQSINYEDLEFNSNQDENEEANDLSESESNWDLESIKWFTREEFNITETRRSGLNILKEKQGVRDIYKFNSLSECFKLFFDSEIIDTIVNCTNLAIDKHSNVVLTTNRDEIYALIGTLMIIASNKDNTLSTTKLWSENGCGRPIYNGCMSRTRFNELLTYLIFDDINDERRTNKNISTYYKIKDIIEPLNANCIKIYSPSWQVVVDETLVLFRGKKLYFNLVVIN